MKPEEQRIAIAEACGWKWGGANGCYLKGDEIARRWELLPDYLNDLNDMHEAERILTPKQEVLYVERLSAQIMTTAYEGDIRYLKSDLCSTELTYRATAAQRAKAFLQTLNLWKY